MEDQTGCGQLGRRSRPCPVRARIAAAGLVLPTAPPVPQASNKKLDEWESLTDAPERHAWQQPNGTGFELGARGLRVPCFAGCAPCERGSADARCAAGIPSIARIL